MSQIVLHENLIDLNEEDVLAVNLSIYYRIIVQDVDLIYVVDGEVHHLDILYIYHEILYFEPF